MEFKLQAGQWARKKLSVIAAVIITGLGVKNYPHSLDGIKITDQRR